MNLQGKVRDGAARSAPPSFAQQRLWLLDRLYPGEAVYNLALIHT